MPEDSLLKKMNNFIRKHSKADLATKLGLKSTNFYYYWNKVGAVPLWHRKALKELLNGK
jgi:hypothetical protein